MGKIKTVPKHANHLKLPYERVKTGLLVKSEERKEELEKNLDDVLCPICLEPPHNAVLLMCEGHERGCKPYLCDTSYRHSNCLDLYRKTRLADAPTGNLQMTENGSNNSQGVPHVDLGVDHPEGDDQRLSDDANNTTEGPDGEVVTFLEHEKGKIPPEAEVKQDPMPPTAETNNSSMPAMLGSLGVDLAAEAGLYCPLCRGKVLGWKATSKARKYLDQKQRDCTKEDCQFSGCYSALRKHAQEEHPTVRPQEADPSRVAEWNRLQFHDEQEDVLSTIRETMPGAGIFGDHMAEQEGRMNIDLLKAAVEEEDREMDQLIPMLEVMRDLNNSGQLGVEEATSLGRKMLRKAALPGPTSSLDFLTFRGSSLGEATLDPPADTQVPAKKARRKRKEIVFTCQGGREGKSNTNSWEQRLAKGYGSFDCLGGGKWGSQTEEQKANAVKIREERQRAKEERNRERERESMEMWQAAGSFVRGCEESAIDDSVFSGGGLWSNEEEFKSFMRMWTEDDGLADFLRQRQEEEEAREEAVRQRLRKQVGLNHTPSTEDEVDRERGGVGTGHVVEGGGGGTGFSSELMELMEALRAKREEGEEGSGDGNTEGLGPREGGEGASKGAQGGSGEDAKQ